MPRAEIVDAPYPYPFYIAPATGCNEIQVIWFDIAAKQYKVNSKWRYPYRVYFGLFNTDFSLVGLLS